jgi:hypothetical protein
VTFPLLFLMLALLKNWGITISTGRTCHRYRIWGIGWSRRQPGLGLATWERWRTLRGTVSLLQ